MARVAGSAGNKQEVEPGHNGARVSTYGPDVGALGVNGRFQFQTPRTGVLAAVAAKTAANGHITHLFNKHATKLLLIHRARAVCQVTVLPATAQEFGLGFYKTTAASVQAAAGGAAVSMATPENKLRKSHADASAAVDCYSANSTTQITVGTYTPVTNPFASETLWALVAGATIPIPKLVLDFDRRNRPLVLEPGEGILLANEVLMANSLAMVLRAEFDLDVVDSYPQ